MTFRPDPPPCDTCGSLGHGTSSHARLVTAYRELQVVTLDELAPASVQIVAPSRALRELGELHGSAVVRRVWLRPGLGSIVGYFTAHGEGWPEAGPTARARYCWGCGRVGCSDLDHEPFWD